MGEQESTAKSEKPGKEQKERDSGKRQSSSSAGKKEKGSGAGRKLSKKSQSKSSREAATAEDVEQPPPVAAAVNSAEDVEQPPPVAAAVNSAPAAASAAVGTASAGGDFLLKMGISCHKMTISGGRWVHVPT